MPNLHSHRNGGYQETIESLRASHQRMSKGPIKGGFYDHLLFKKKLGNAFVRKDKPT